MNKSIKAINKKDISNSRTQYLNHIRLYKISITVLRFLILVALIAAWEISTRTGILNPFIFSSPSRICTTFIAMAKDNSIFIFLPYYNCRNGSSNSSLAVERLIRLP